MSKFIIIKVQNNKCQFDLKANDGKLILSSHAYATKLKCENSIEAIRINSKLDSKYVRKTLLNGSAYFKLKATNEEIIWTSDIYENGAARDAVIESLKKYAPNATIDDQTVLEYL